MRNSKNRIDDYVIQLSKFSYHHQKGDIPNINHTMFTETVSLNFKFFFEDNNFCKFLLKQNLKCTAYLKILKILENIFFFNLISDINSLMVETKFRFCCFR